MGIKKFREWLRESDSEGDGIYEHAQAIEGDLEDYQVDDYDKTKTLNQKYKDLYSITKTVVNTQWVFIGNIKDKHNTSYRLLHNKNMPDTYIITQEDPEKETDSDAWFYSIVCKVDLDKQQKLETKLNVKNLYRVKEIIMVPDVRGNYLSKNLYKYFVKNLKLIILGDSEQYFGARRLWTRLSKEFDIIVDIVDVDKGEYVEKNTTIHHGDLDGEFDKRIWSRAEDKLHIRTLLRDIK